MIYESVPQTTPPQQWQPTTISEALQTSRSLVAAARVQAEVQANREIESFLAKLEELKTSTINLVLSSMAEQFATVHERHKTAIEKLYQDGIQVILALAKHTIGEALPTSANGLSKRVEDALTKLAIDSKASLFFHPADAPVMINNLKQQKELSGISINTDHCLARGAFRIAWDDITITSDPMKHFDALRAHLIKQVAHD